MEKIDITRNQIVNQILRVGHGDLSIYEDIGLQAVNSEPELFAHLIAWNHIKGEVRDSKVALPVIALRGDRDEELYENAAAHLCLLDPRNLLRAVKFNGDMKKNGAGGVLKTAVKKYISAREENKTWWTRTALQHRSSMKALYVHYHIKPNALAQMVLFDRKAPKGSVFEAVKNLKNMKSLEAAGTILNFRIPFIIAIGALGGIKNKPDIILALIEKMSGAELINNTNMLKKMGVFESPVLKEAYNSAIKRTEKDKVSTLKASKAAEVVGDKKVKEKLKKIQEDRLQKLGGIDGDWLVLGDMSPSMGIAIELAKEVAGLIAKQVNGKVHLVFFSDRHRSFEVTGKTLDEIKEMTKRVQTNGRTSIGVGLDYLLKNGESVNGIAICSDGQENTQPYFHDVYKKYCAKFGLEPPVYLYHIWNKHGMGSQGDFENLTPRCSDKNIMVEKFSLGHNVDYYSLPNLIKTMRTSRYTLVEEIMETKLLTFKDVFK